MALTMKEKMERIAALPDGLKSSSGHYWCATCKKLFRMDTPTCPYMTGMCINNAIPVEEVQPPNPVAFERFGLFYPKFPQRALARLSQGIKAAQRQELGWALASAYLDELNEWRVEFKNNPIETIKSFLIFLSSCEVSQRHLEGKMLFVILDPETVWPDRQLLRDVSIAALESLAKDLGFALSMEIDFIEILPSALGRYYCPKCSMYFEFGKARDKVICPLMPQKCMFEPSAISGSYPLKDIIKLYRITPGLYARFMKVTLGFGAVSAQELQSSLDQEISGWGFEGTDEEWKELHSLLGL